MSATELVCAAPLQQRLRRSSVAAALRAASAPSQQHQLRHGRDASYSSRYIYNIQYSYCAYIEYSIISHTFKMCVLDDYTTQSDESHHVLSPLGLLQLSSSNVVPSGEPARVGDAGLVGTNNDERDPNDPNDLACLPRLDSLCI